MKIIETKELIWDKFVWPRAKRSSATIESYKMAMEVGAKFPPIEIQHICNYPKIEEDKEIRIEAIVIVDGVHRWEATKKCKDRKTIEYTEWQPGKVLDYEKNKIVLAIRALFLNLKHGHDLVESDRKSLAERIAENDPKIEWSGVKLAKLFGRPEQTISDWVGHIRTRQKASKNAVVYRLSRLGWTQDKIAEIDGRTQPTIQEIIGKSDFGEIDNLWLEHDVPYLAQHFHMDLPLVWSILLENKTDEELAKAVSQEGEAKDLGFRIYPYDYWPISGCMDIAGRDHPGRIPGQLVANTLYFFTERGEMIIDPMAGGGTVPDIALIMGRKCYAYDIDLRHDRPDILCHNMLENGWPPRAKKANLIFWDPPYFEKKDKDYMKDSISALPRKEYLEFFQERLAESYSLVKQGTRLAFLMADWDDPEGGLGIYIWDYIRLIQNAEWDLFKHIQVPLPTQQFHPDFVIKFWKTKQLGRLERYLLIARK